MNKRVFLWTGLIVAALAAAGRADDTPLPTTAQIKTLVEAGQYKEALKPLFRVLSLKGSAATSYDRYELLMLRGECQLQIKDQHAALDSLDQARKEAFAENKPERAAAPTGLAFLVQRSTAYQYKSKGEPGAKGIPILDRTLRPAAYGALLADELPAARQKVQSLNNARTLPQVLEAAKVAGAVHALEVLSKPQAATLETTPLAGQVTTNADRLMSTALDDLTKTADTISATANQIIRDQVGHYDQISKKSWLEQRTRRRGPSDQEAQTLAAIATTCDKLRASAVEMAVALATDFETYKAIVVKAEALKQKAAGILNEDYLAVPP